MPFDKKAYMKKYLRDYHLKRKAFLKESKNVPCRDCKIKYPSYVMEFDHVVGGKVANVNFLQHRRSIESLKKEMDKCEIVCANCHRRRTYERSLKTEFTRLCGARESNPQTISGTRA